MLSEVGAASLPLNCRSAGMGGIFTMSGGDDYDIYYIQ